MPRTTTKSVAKLERLSTELNSYQCAERSGDIVAFIRAENRLLDAAVDCGMDYDHADLAGWASEAVVSFLCAA